jgi:hypothetical protein
MKAKALQRGTAALLVAALAGALFSAAASDTEPARAEGEAGRLAVVWTSGDPDVAHRVCFMYTHNAKTQEWFDEVRLVVWGPSARLLAGDKDLQAKIKAMMSDGVEVQACIVCADSYGVTERLRALGIEVKPMGRPLSTMLKDGYKVLTF